MKEAAIHRRADVVHFNWQIRSADGINVAVGQDKAGEDLQSANVDFLDNERKLLLDANGVVRLIPAAAISFSLKKAVRLYASGCGIAAAVGGKSEA
jgi:hypothetical protein